MVLDNLIISYHIKQRIPGRIALRLLLAGQLLNITRLSWKNFHKKNILRETPIDKFRWALATSLLLISWENNPLRTTNILFVEDSQTDWKEHYPLKLLWFNLIDENGDNLKITEII